MLYIDSNIFLYPIVYEVGAVEEAKRSRDLLLRIALGDVEACTSIITWEEVVWVVRRVFGLEPSIEQGKRFLTFPNLKFLAVKKSVILRAQELLEKYRVKPRDAIHAATAIENKITNIASYDKDFDIIREIKRIEP
ncbi:MAG: type II toxin-antitoxin system VapC family toxin [Candidatus Bathyarchaeia archaeon]|nr:type II toxin-antitoxin system VapC family toxin [Candidatus Bathyarchaeota archaeon]